MGPGEELGYTAAVGQLDAKRNALLFLILLPPGRWHFSPETAGNPAEALDPQGKVLAKTMGGLGEGQFEGPAMPQLLQEVLRMCEEMRQCLRCREGWGKKPSN